MPNTKDNQKLPPGFAGDMTIMALMGVGAVVSATSQLRGNGGANISQTVRDGLTVGGVALQLITAEVAVIRGRAQDINYAIADANAAAARTQAARTMRRTGEATLRRGNRPRSQRQGGRR